MNISKVLNILLALSLLILLLKTQVGSLCPVKKDDSVKALDKQEIVLNNIHERKSVRSYTEKELIDEQLQTLVKAGMAAPTAANKQPWHFIIVTQRAVLDEFAANLPYAKMLKNAPAAIIVCGDTTKTLPDIEEEYWIQDCSAATQNILLAVEAMDLGAVWTGIHPMPERIALATKLLGLPDHIKPLNVIAIGYPKGNPKPKNKWNEKALHWEMW